jgi:hypothetical protein
MNNTTDKPFHSFSEKELKNFIKNNDLNLRDPKGFTLFESLLLNKIKINPENADLWDIIIEKSDFNNKTFHNKSGTRTTLILEALSLNTKLNMLPRHFSALIHKSTLNDISENGRDTLTQAIYHNHHLRLSQEDFIYLIKKSDLTNRGNGHTALFYSLFYNNRNRLNFTPEIWDLLIKKSNINTADPNNNNLLMVILNHNKSENLNFTSKMIDPFLTKENISKTNAENHSSLMFLIRNYKKQNLDVTPEQTERFFEFTDLEKITKNNYSHLMYAVKYNKNGLHLTKEQWNKLYLSSNHKQKENPQLAALVATKFITNELPELSPEQSIEIIKSVSIDSLIYYIPNISNEKRDEIHKNLKTTINYICLKENIKGHNKNLKQNKI